MDFFAWVNLDGKGFVQIEKDKITKGCDPLPKIWEQLGFHANYPPHTPDWLERMAAETINECPEVLPYVSWINHGVDLIEVACYLRGTKHIQINELIYAGENTHGSYWNSKIRYNLLIWPS